MTPPSGSPDEFDEFGDGWEPIFAEIERGDLSATVVAVPEEVMGGWTVRVFPTLDENRVVVGLNHGWLQDLLFDTMIDGGTMEDLKEYLNNEAVKSVHSYFKVLGKTS